jgi:hypothetical protein
VASVTSTASSDERDEVSALAALSDSDTESVAARARGDVDGDAVSLTLIESEDVRVDACEDAVESETVHPSVTLRGWVDPAADTSLMFRASVTERVEL